MENRSRIFGCTLLLWCAATSATGCHDHSDASTRELRARMLEQVLEDQAGAQDFIGASLVVIKDADIESPWGWGRVLASTAVGQADIEHDVALSPEHSFRYASISKTYIAMMMVRAHVQGRLRLDDPITATFPGSALPYVPAEIVALVPHAAQVTLGSLLDHSCSLYDYRDLAFILDLLDNPYDHLDEEQELLDGLARGLASDQAPTECQVFYSNSNYGVAGMILDRLHGDHSAELHDILTTRMELSNTYYEKHFTWQWSFDYSELAHSYLLLPGEDEVRDVTWVDEGHGFASGGLIGTPADAARFFSIVFSDRNPAPMDSLEEKAAFLDIFTTPNDWGVAPGNFVDDGYHVHGGSLGGHQSIAMYSPQYHVAIVVYTNDGSRFPDLPGQVADAVKEVVDAWYGEH